MSDLPSRDVDLGERLRASIDGGDLPAPDLADVQRRADRHVRRRAVGTTAVAGVSALAVVGAVALAVPAINTVTGARTTSSASASGIDRVGVGADPSGDLVDPSLWPGLTSLDGHRRSYWTPTQVASAAGFGTWDDDAADMFSRWAAKQCSPGPLRGGVDAEPGVGPRPSSFHVEAWAAQPSQPAPSPPSGTPLPLPYKGVAFLSVLRWEPAMDDAGRNWQQTTAKEAAACPGALALGTQATIATMPVTVIAQPLPSNPAVIPDASWSAMAITAGGPTSVQVHYIGGSSAQAAGDAALALLREGVKAVAAGDRATAQVEAGPRAGGVSQDRLSDFTDLDRGNTVPPLHTIGPPPKVALSTSADLEIAFPATRSWQGQPIGGTGTDWLRSWCTPQTIIDPKIPNRPGDSIGGGAPGSESASIWQGRSNVLGRPRVDVDVLRWHSRDPGASPGGVAGVDTIALSAADAWGAAIASDATACPGATTLDPTGLPGTHAALSAVREGGDWRVQAVAVGGPTAVRVRATITADDAAAAGSQAVAMARRVIANTVRSDDVEQGRADPGPLR